MQLRVPGIYQIQSVIKPERVYIGSAANIHKRWVGHRSKLKNDIHGNGRIQNHYNKYGKDDLVFSILTKCVVEELVEQEQYFIDLCKPFFNIRVVAHSNIGVKFTAEARKNMSIAAMGIGKGVKFSEEHKKNLSIAHIGYKCSEEHCKNMSLAGMGNKHSVGRKHSEETKRKMSEAHKGRVTWNKGMKMSEEFCASVREGMKKGKEGVSK